MCFEAVAHLSFPFITQVLNFDCLTRTCLHLIQKPVLCRNG
ncbi:hypothetical protein NC651_029945 [Populus alba x Populus x berolinensis]|nr:hypothetical protein NC651_029945 [Populus alba x Populus x berolinensis]